MIYLSQNIKYLRGAKKLSQEALAEVIGVNRTQVASYEDGVWPKAEVLLTLSRCFKVSIDDLLRKKLEKSDFIYNENLEPVIPEQDKRIERLERRVDDLIAMNKNLIEANRMLAARVKVEEEKK